MLIKLRPGDLKNQLKRMNQKVDEYNGKSMGNGRYRKVFLFSINEFWDDIGCLVSASNFGLEGYRLW